MKLTPAQNTQLRAFELDLYGFQYAEIAEILNKEQGLTEFTLDEDMVSVLVKAETIAYAISTELGYAQREDSVEITTELEKLQGE